MGSSETSERVRAVIGGALAGTGLFVDSVTVTPAGKRRVVRVHLDRDLEARWPEDDTSPVPPVDLDEVADATRLVEAALDDPADPARLGNAPYVLEVGSPGVDRPLTLPRHFRANVGRVVTLSLRDGSTYTGRIVSAGRAAAGDAGTTVEGNASGSDVVAEVMIRAVTPSGTSKASKAARERSIAYGEIAQGRIQVEFSRMEEDIDDIEEAGVADEENES